MPKKNGAKALPVASIVSPIFEKRMVEVEYKGEVFTYLTSISQGDYDEIVKDSDNIKALQKMLVGWTIGGQVSGEFVFPEIPTTEALYHLPMDFVAELTALSGEAMNASLGKMIAARSKRTTTR